jgi:hypothetical protein
LESTHDHHPPLSRANVISMTEHTCSGGIRRACLSRPALVADQQSGHRAPLPGGASWERLAEENPDIQDEKLERSSPISWHS